MTEIEKRAFVRDWNLAHGWRGDELDRGHDVLIECAERFLERFIHMSGIKEFMEYEQSRL